MIKSSAGDYITVIRSERANKLIRRMQDGTIDKERARPISYGIARTYHVPDVRSFSALIKQVSEKPNLVLVQGYFKGTEDGKPFRVYSKQLLAERLGIDPSSELIDGAHEINGKRAFARKNSNIAPTCWLLFDRDYLDEMPLEIRELVSDDDKFDAAMERMLPGFGCVARISYQSNSGRVLVDGEPLKSGGKHTWVHLADPESIHNIGVVLLVRATAIDLTFDRTWGEHRRLWSFFDPSTLSVGRIVYDGKPRVADDTGKEGITVVELDLHVSNGERLATPSTLSDRECHEFAEKSSSAVSVAPDSHLCFESQKLLMLDTKIETEKGVLALKEFWEGADERLRCQATFRESSSWNGILGRHADSSPFLFDNGARQKYVLSELVLAEHKVAMLLRRYKVLDPERVKDIWVTNVSEWTRAEQLAVVEELVNVLKLRKPALKERLNASLGDLKKQKKDQIGSKKLASAKESGLEVIHWDPLLLPAITARVSRRLGDISKWSEEVLPVLSQAGRLVTIEATRPGTLQQMLDSSKGRYRPGATVRSFDGRRGDLRVRIQQQFQFMVDTSDGPRFEAANRDLVDGVMETGHRFAPPLVGLVDHPLVLPSGEIKTTPGYDQETGLFLSALAKVQLLLPEHITQAQAAASYRWLRKNLLAEFPFQDEVNAAAAVACLLTMLMRPFLMGMSGFPGFLVSAPMQGTGKTTLLELLWRCVNLRPLPMVGWPSKQSEEELKKHVLAMALEGQAGVAFDNVSEGMQLDSGVVAMLLTSELISGRLLQQSRTAAGLAGIILFFSGNNIRLTGDLMSRVLPIYLDAGSALPDRRDFSRGSLVEWCANNRAEVLLHACTILAGAFRAGISELGADWKPTRFKPFDRLVRAPMQWAGAEDPAELFERTRANDSKTDENDVLLSSLYRFFGADPFQASLLEGWFSGPVEFADTVADALASGSDHDSKEDAVQAVKASLRELMRLPSWEQPSARRIGEYFAKIENRVVGGLKLVRLPSSGKSRRSAKWVVVLDLESMLE